MFPGVAVITGAGGTGKPTLEAPATLTSVTHINTQESAPQLQKLSLQLVVPKSLSQTLMTSP